MRRSILLSINITDQIVIVNKYCTDHIVIETERTLNINFELTLNPIRTKLGRFVLNMNNAYSNVRRSRQVK